MGDNMTAFEQLKQKLHEIFQLDKRELDFGIYCIMNLKADEIASFIDNDLLAEVKSELENYTANDNKDIKNQLAKAIENAKNLGVDPDASPKVKELKSKLSQAFDAEKTEIEIYSDLYNFFKRYYSEGDFLSLRRYKEGVYALPYEGEEVKLYWANADQYYVKSSETLTNYTFKAGPHKIRFEVVDATTEQNNNKAKEECRFKLLETNPVRQENGEYIVSFSYLPDSTNTKQEELNKQAVQALLQNSVLSPCLADLRTERGTGKNKSTLLGKHLDDFTAKNTFDYFIHKNLGKFLRRELDFYIKNEMMHLDDIETENAPRVEQYLAKIKAFRKIAGKIITFLASLEDFQKKLWLKKKFVLETNYCITLDRMPGELYAEIAANEAQRKEWVKLFAIDEITQDTTRVGYSEPLTEEFLKENPFLVLDTALFSQEFKYKLLAQIDDLDKQCNGLLIHSENFQALHLLQEKYREKVQCIYIDPPYNTDASKIAYKNGYEHSSWISLMELRLSEGRKLMDPTGIIEVAIDDYELRYLNTCMDQVFGIDNAISNIAILTNPKGRDQGFIAQAHDYTVMYARDKRIAETHNFVLTEEELAKKFAKSKDGEALRELPLKRTGSGKRREDRPYMYFPFFYSPTKKDLIVIPEEQYKCIYNAVTDSFDDNFLSAVIKEYEQRGYIAILPLSSKGEKFRWRWGYNSCVAGINSGILFCKSVRSGEYAIYQYDFADDEATPKSLWFGERYDASSKGTNLLESIIPNNPFDFPKSLYTVKDNLIIGAGSEDIILDYFAGSGTTGHAVIALNRDDKEQGKRKYILCEMGTYFDTVTKPRIEKVIYSKDWKNGKPVSREGSSHCFKYIRLESYEDTLDNLFFVPRTNIQELALSDDKSIKEEYMLKYMMNLETKDSLLTVHDFNQPFDYTLNITRNGETKRVSVDLVETFNYLIGLEVRNIQESRGVVSVEGITRKGETVLVLWRDVTKTDNEALNTWFEKRAYSTQDHEFDVIYVNGDNNLENLRKEDETWKVRLTEAEFLKRMFDMQEA